MADSDELRAGDADRDRTISQIREAYAEGRLDTDEFQSRMSGAQQARTYGDLAQLVRDLPVQPSPAAPAPVPTSSAAVREVAGADRDERNLRKGWASWVGVSIMVNVIWLGTWITGDEGAPPYWPIWVMGPWGAAMVIATLTRRAR